MRIQNYGKFALIFGDLVLIDLTFCYQVRKKNEELRLAAEKKRFEEEQRKKKIEEEYQADLRRQAEMKFEHHNTDEPVS